MIAVTGGFGFIGNELVRQLMQAGEDVHIIDNLNRRAPRIGDLDKLPVANIDITDFPALSSWFQVHQPEAVYHLAAIHYIPECNENPERTLRVNVEGTQSVLRAAAQAGVMRVVFASSGAVYADLKDPLQETSLIGPVDIYGQSKLFGEHLCELAGELYGLNIVMARLFNNYGPRETNPHIIPETINQLRQGNRLNLGRINTIRDYIHVSDCAEALRRLAKADITGVVPVNVATGKGYTVSEVIDLIAQATGRRIYVDHDSGRVRRFDKETQVASVERLSQLTGWRPSTAMSEGIKQLIRFEGLI